MRFAVGGIAHETNTFSPIRTTLDLFGVHAGDMFERYRGTNTGIGGFLGFAQARGVELVPTLYAGATPQAWSPGRPTPR